MAADLSGIISSTGVALEQEAFKQFGAAVEGVAGGALKDIFGVPPGSPSGTGTNPTVHENGVWDTTRYAAALVRPDQVEFNPKLKFMFKVSFEFDQAMIDAARKLGYDLSRLQNHVSFMIRHVDRPKYDYVYEEVNMYNFRTKILKQITHRELAFTMYDDVGNNVLSFFNLYRKLLQPIARNSVDPLQTLEDYGFQFDQTLQGLDTSFRSSLPGDRRNIFNKMTVHQIYVERGSSNNVPSSWVKTVDFVFINPRFTNIDFDDMDHENGGAFNLVTCSVDFDTMYMNEPKAFTQDTTPSLSTGDIPANGANGSTNAQGGTRNPIIDMVVNQASRLTQTATSDLINKTLGTSAGGKAIAGSLTSVSSLIGQQTKNTLNSLGSGGAAFATPSSPLVTDDSTSGSSVPDLSSRVSADDFGQFI